ncbi:MAG: hypothetical protein KF774_09130 [Planctomyces sp.]|nr:hypothetical protein [Planctomyces sp.]
MTNTKKQGMSTFAKVLIGMLVAGVLVVVVTCGGLYWFARNAFKPTQDPVEIAALKDSMINIEIPETYRPVGGMTMQMGFSMKMAMYARNGDEKSGGAVMLMQMNIPGAGDQQTRQSFEDQLRQQGHNSNLKVATRETRSVDIDGKAYDFEFLTGTREGADTKLHEVIGQFPAKQGVGFLMITDSDEHWDEAAVMRMLESISTK